MVEFEAVDVLTVYFKEPTIPDHDWFPVYPSTNSEPRFVAISEDTLEKILNLIPNYSTYTISERPPMDTPHHD